MLIPDPDFFPIPDPDFFPIPDPDPGVKEAPDSGLTTLVTRSNTSTTETPSFAGYYKTSWGGNAKTKHLQSSFSIQLCGGRNFCLPIISNDAERFRFKHKKLNSFVSHMAYRINLLTNFRFSLRKNRKNRKIGKVFICSTELAYV
jgi:hypothetical protein